MTPLVPLDLFTLAAAIVRSHALMAGVVTKPPRFSICLECSGPIAEPFTFCPRCDSPRKEGR